MARGTAPGKAAGLFGLGAGILLIAVNAGGRGPRVVWEKKRRARVLADPRGKGPIYEAPR